MKKASKTPTWKQQMGYQGKRVALPDGENAEGRAPRRERKKLRRRRLSRRELTILLIPAVAAVAAVLVVLFTVDKGASYTFEDGGRQYYAGSSAVIEAGTELKRTEDGLVQFDDTAPAESYLPVYLDRANTLVLTCDMLYYTPRNGSYGLARCFSEISRQENGLITVTCEGNSVKPESGFLYDGEDFYIFLEPVTVSCMGYNVELPPLSYAEVVNSGHVMLFNYETKKFFMEPLDGGVLAETLNGEYTVSLLGDSMVDQEDERTLLSARPELFEPIV